MKKIQNKNKLQESIDKGIVIPFDKIFAQQLKEGLYTKKNFNKDFKAEMEENARLLRAGTAKKVRVERLKAQISQQELAKRLHTSKSFISEIENGKQNISIEYASKIARALNKEFVWQFK